MGVFRIGYNAPEPQAREPSMTDEMKACPECAEQVKVQALLCRYCKYDFRTRTSGRVAPPVRPASAATKKKGFPVWAIVLMSL